MSNGIIRIDPKELSYTMDSSDEDDIHQCGRCKEIFHTIEAYFAHKKAKACHKNKDDANTDSNAQYSFRKATSRTRISRNMFEDPPSNTHGKSSGQDSIGHSKHDNSIQEADTMFTNIIKPIECGRRRKIKHQYIPKNITSDMECNPKNGNRLETRSDVFTRLRDRGKIVPKKKWADDFEEISREGSSFGNDTASCDKSSSLTKKRRGRPAKSTKYSHIFKPVRPYQKQHIYSCPECDHVTNYKDEYDRHLRVFHRLSTHICVNCHLPFGDKYKLRRHQEMKICSKDAESKVPTPKFMQFKSTNRIYRHPFTDSSADAKGEVNVKGPSKEQKENPCINTIVDILGKTDGNHSSGELVRNTDGCIDVNEFSCRECDETFSTFDDITEHVHEQHTGMVPGICDFCGKWFSSKYRLWRHMTSSVHDHVTPEQLSVSKKRVRSMKVSWKASDKQKQERYRKYNCVKCKKMFNARSLYLQHMKKVHNPCEMSQKHICDWCSSVMVCSLSTFQLHLERAHKVKAKESSCTCVVCNKIFNQKSHVVRHKETLHTPHRLLPREQLAKEDETDDCIISSDSNMINRQVGNNKTTTLTGDHEENVGEEISKGDSYLGKVFSCFVCYVHNEEQTAHREHLEMHRVWVPDTEKDGPFPKDMFSSATQRSLTLTSESSNAQKQRKRQPSIVNTDPGVVVDIADACIDHSSHDSTLDGIGEEAMNTSDDDQTDTSKVLKMIMQLDSGHCDFRLPCDGNHETKINNAKTKCKNSDLKVPIGIKYMIDQSENIDNFDADEHIESTDTTIQQHNKGSPQDGNDFICPFCNMHFNVFNDKYLHLVNHHRLTAVFKCVLSSCSKTFENLDNYISHNNIHTQKAFICNVCNEHVSNMSLLLAHKAVIHRKIAPTENRCSFCKMMFSDRKELEDHMIIGDLVHFPCDVCSKVTRSHGELEIHKRIHGDVKPFLCEHCGMGFSNQLALTRHRVSHSEVRPHKCAECVATFNKREHLLRHMLSKHSEEKPFTCNICSKSFKRRDKLYEHQRTHTTEKPFVCQMCGTDYRHKEGLKYHIKTHAREKKYVCSECSVQFPRPGLLRRHLQEKHGIKTREQHMYPCSLCPLMFSRPERVRRHMERVHKSAIHWQAVCQLCNKGFPGEKSLNTHMTQVHADGVCGDTKVSTANVALPVITEPTTNVSVPNAAISTDQFTRTPVGEVQSLYQVIKEMDRVPNMPPLTQNINIVSGQSLLGDSNLTTLSNVIACVDNNKLVTVANAQPTVGGGSHMIVSKGSSITAGTTDPMTVFMYVHSPVQPENESIKQPVFAQTEANIEMPLQESPMNAITVNILDIVNGAQSIVDTSQVTAVSYLPSYDQHTSTASTAIPSTSTQYSFVSELGSHGNVQYGISSNSSNHNNVQCGVLSPQQKPEQTRSQICQTNTQIQNPQTQPKQTSTSLTSQNAQLMDPHLSLAQLSYRTCMPHDNSATQQLLQLISLEALSTSASPGSGMSTQGNESSGQAQALHEPNTLHTRAVSSSALPTGSSNLQTIGNLQHNPSILTPNSQIPGILTASDMSIQHAQSVLEINQSSPINNMHALDNSNILASQHFQTGTGAVLHQLQGNILHQTSDSSVTNQLDNNSILSSNSQLSTRSLLPSRTESYGLEQGTDLATTGYTPFLQPPGQTPNIPRSEMR